MKLNIHFPVDWVLLRDATRTLVKAIRLIRKQGLKKRMPEPQAFLKRMNQLAMEMTRQGRRSGRPEGTQGDAAGDEETGEGDAGARAAAPGLAGQELGGDRTEPGGGGQPCANASR